MNAGEMTDDVVLEVMRRPDGSIYARATHAMCRATM